MIDRQEQRALVEAGYAPLAPYVAQHARCAHDYEREPYGGPVQVLRCTKCGDTVERDVS